MPTSMSTLTAFFGKNMVLVFFVYGLAWFVVGLSIAIEARKSLGLTFARSLWYLAAFGFLHSLVEWSDMLLLIPADTNAISSSALLRAAKALLLGISAAFLVKFGVDLIITTSPKYRWLNGIPYFLPSLWIAITLILPNTQPLLVAQQGVTRSLCVYCHATSALTVSPLGVWHPTAAIAEIWARYLVYFPGLLLTAIGLLRQARVFQQMALPNIASDTRCAAAAFAVNAVFAGLVVAPAPYFPANIFNYNVFLGTIGIPPQVFRAIMALIIAYFVVRILHVFEIEHRNQLDRAQQERFQAQIHALQELNRMKTEFVSNVSHELRTPLNSIIGFSELLIDQIYGPLNEKQLRQINNIYISGKHLLQIVNDILDLSKIEAGKMEPHIEEFSISEALESALQTARQLAANRQLAIELKLDRSPAKIKADQRMFNQIMLNLLSNAIKFTPDGGSIAIEAQQRDGEIIVAVTDTGIGIKKEDQERIFHEFQQVETSLSRQYGGTGLGLALTKRLVELHGGRIWVESEPGHGSTFRFALPTN